MSKNVAKASEDVNRGGEKTKKKKFNWFACENYSSDMARIKIIAQYIGQCNLKSNIFEFRSRLSNTQPLAFILNYTKSSLVRSAKRSEYSRFQAALYICVRLNKQDEVIAE